MCEYGLLADVTGVAASKFDEAARPVKYTLRRWRVFVGHPRSLLEEQWLGGYSLARVWDTCYPIRRTFFFLLFFLLMSWPLATRIYVHASLTSAVMSYEGQEFFFFKISLSSAYNQAPWVFVVLTFCGSVYLCHIRTILVYTWGLFILEEDEKSLEPEPELVSCAVRVSTFFSFSGCLWTADAGRFLIAFRS